MEPIEIYGKVFAYKERRGDGWSMGPVDIWCYSYPNEIGIIDAYYLMRSPAGWAVRWDMPQRDTDTWRYDWYHDLGELVERESGAARGVLCPLVNASTGVPTLEQFVELRKRLGWSARDVSVRLRLHETYVSRIERGEREFRPVYYYALLGLSVARGAE